MYVNLYALKRENFHSYSLSLSPLTPLLRRLLQELVSWYNMVWSTNKMQITPQLEFAITAINSSTSVAVGTWASSSLLTLNPNYEHSPIRRFFRIGTVMVGGFTLPRVLGDRGVLRERGRGCV